MHKTLMSAAVLLGVLFAAYRLVRDADVAKMQAAPPAAPVVPDKDKSGWPPKHPRPWREVPSEDGWIKDPQGAFDEDQIVRGMSTGGPIGPDGKTEVQCYLPVELRQHNTGGRDGAGLCVFTSIEHAARYQHVPQLEDFQAYMKQYPGGGFPEKVTQYVNRLCKEKGYPVPRILQYEGNDLAILKAALESGRMPSVTYNGHDPHYRGSIAHMVSLAHLDSNLACVLDNNYIKDNELVWMTPAEFLQRFKGDGGWAVILLGPPPPPVPRN